MPGGYELHAINKHPTDSSSLDYSFSTSCLRFGKNVGVSVGCLRGVWEVPGGCLSDSGYCLEGYGVNSFDKNPIGIILISCVIFSQWPFLSKF